MEAVAAMDIPSADAINTFIVSKAVRQAGLKVALSGLGGDELFCGYPSFWEIPRLSFLEKIPPTLARSLVSFSPSGVREKFEGAPSFDAFTLALLRRRWWSNRHLKLAGLEASVEWPKPPESFLDTTQAITQAEMLGYMEPMLLRDSDQMSMAVGLELRVPFLDHRLVEFVLALPEQWKRGKPPKRLLIDAFADILPQEVWNRPKQGFALPMDSWMRGPLRDFCREGIELARQQLDRTFLEFAVQGFEKRSLHWTRLWQLVVFGHYSGK
jgi:asparagine synthase (glutamine-hydrolysing)